MKKRTCRLILLTLFLLAPHAWAGDDSLGFSTPAVAPCLDLKGAPEKFDDPTMSRLKEAYLGVNPFSHDWPGTNARFNFKDHKATVIIKDEGFLRAMAEAAGHKAVEPVDSVQACINLNGKPYIQLQNKGFQAKQYFLKNGKVTVGEGMESDTFTVLASPRPEGVSLRIKTNASSPAASQAPALAPSIQ